jgi:hypothetical protein
MKARHLPEAVLLVLVGERKQKEKRRLCAIEPPM